MVTSPVAHASNPTLTDEEWEEMQDAANGGGRGGLPTTWPGQQQRPNATNQGAVSGSLSQRAAAMRTPPHTGANTAEISRVAGTAQGRDARIATQHAHDIDIRTPGKVGASSGGMGLSPQTTWDKWFPNRANMGKEGIANAPAATNFRPGDAGTNSLAEKRTVTPTPIPKPTIRPDGTKTDVPSVAQNLALEQHPNTPTPTPAEPGVNSPAIQGALNAAAGIQTSQREAGDIARKYGGGAAEKLAINPPAATTPARPAVPSLTDPRHARMELEPSPADAGKFALSPPSLWSPIHTPSATAAAPTPATPAATTSTTPAQPPTTPAAPTPTPKISWTPGSTAAPTPAQPHALSLNQEPPAPPRFTPTLPVAQPHGMDIARQPPFDYHAPTAPPAPTPAPTVTRTAPAQPSATPQPSLSLNQEPSAAPGTKPTLRVADPHGMDFGTPAPATARTAPAATATTPPPHPSGLSMSVAEPQGMDLAKPAPFNVTPPTPPPAPTAFRNSQPNLRPTPSMPLSYHNPAGPDGETEEQKAKRLGPRFDVDGGSR